MKNITKKLAAITMAATMFFSLTAFTTNTGDSQECVCCCHEQIVDLNCAAGTHECGRYRNWNTTDWTTTDWKFSGLGWDIQYRYRDTTVSCAICGRVFSSSRQLQKRDRVAYLWVNDWYDIDPSTWW